MADVFGVWGLGGSSCFPTLDGRAPASGICSPTLVRPIRAPPFLKFKTVHTGEYSKRERVKRTQRVLTVSVTYDEKNETHFFAGVSSF